MKKPIRDQQDANADDASADLEETQNMSVEDTQRRRGLSVAARTIAGGYNPYDALPDQGKAKRKKRR